MSLSQSGLANDSVRRMISLTSHARHAGASRKSSHWGLLPLNLAAMLRGSLATAVEPTYNGPPPLRRVSSA